jgi:hypothetical protein
LAKGSIPEQEQLQERNGHAASNQPLWPNDSELRWNRLEEKNARDQTGEGPLEGATLHGHPQQNGLTRSNPLHQ